MAAGSMTAEDIERRMKKCPACNGEGYVNIRTEQVRFGSHKTNFVTLIDADECEICEGVGEVSDDS